MKNVLISAQYSAAFKDQVETQSMIQLISAITSQKKYLKYHQSHFIKEEMETQTGR